MVDFPKVPTQIVYTGDKSKGRQYTGLGKKRFSDLVTALSYIPSPANEVGHNTLKLDNGVKIKTSVSFGLSKIEIFTPIVEGGAEKKLAECYCDCGVTTAKIKEGLEAGEIPQQDTTYKVAFCRSILHLSASGSSAVKAMDFYPHTKGDLAYALIQDKDKTVGDETTHIQLNSISPCKWNLFRLLSLEVRRAHYPVTVQ